MVITHYKCININNLSVGKKKTIENISFYTIEYNKKDIYLQLPYLRMIYPICKKMNKNIYFADLYLSNKDNRHDILLNQIMKIEEKIYSNFEKIDNYNEYQAYSCILNNDNYTNYNKYIRFNLPKYDNEINVEVYTENINKEHVKTNISYLKPNILVKPIIKCSGVWFDHINKRYGLSWNIHQIKKKSISYPRIP